MSIYQEMSHRVPEVQQTENVIMLWSFVIRFIAMLLIVTIWQLFGRMRKFDMPKSVMFICLLKRQHIVIWKIN